MASMIVSDVLKWMAAQHPAVLAGMLAQPPITN